MNFKTLSVMALAGLVVLGSCKKNEQNTNNNGSVLYAGIEQPTSNAKTTLDPSTGVINWTAGDKIMVNNGIETAMFNLTEGEGGTIATFKGPSTYEEAEENYVAAFPADYVDNISGTTVTFNIPSEQTPNTGNPMVAYGTDENLTFSSVLGGVIIKLKGNGSAKTINKLVLTSNAEENLWGTYTLEANNVPSNPSLIGGSNAVTLNLPNITLADDQVYTTCVMVPGGTLRNGFNIEILYNGLSLKSVNTNTPESGNWEGITIATNTLEGTVTYKYPADVVTPSATNATLANQQQLSVLLSQVEGGSYSGNITLAAGTSEAPVAFDFGMDSIDAPITNRVVVANSANVEIENLYSEISVKGEGAINVGVGATVVLDNVHLYNEFTGSDPVGYGSRGINVDDDANVTISGGSVIEAVGGYSRGLNVYGKNAVVTVEPGAKIKAGHYAINIPGAGQNVEINLQNNTLSAGWAALNIWGQNNTINATNCIFRGTNDKPYNAEGWNDFATIVFNHASDDVYCQGANVTFDNCQIYAETVSGNGNKQFAIRMSPSNNHFTINGGSITGIHTNAPSYKEDQTYDDLYDFDHPGDADNQWIWVMDAVENHNMHGTTSTITTNGVTIDWN